MLKVLACPTGWSFSGESRDEIDTTCLSDNDATFLMGIKDNGTLSSTVNYDASEETHQLLQSYLQNNVENIWFCVAYSDGTAAPTVDSAGGFDLPATRSYKTFQGLLASVSETGQSNSVVTSDITVRISGPVNRSYKS
jgi:hypothetical protein